MTQPRWLLALALALVFAPATPAEAHAPAILSASEPYVVDDPAVSRALYGTFASAADVFVIEVPVAQRIALPFELLVPHRDGLRGHRPAFALIGPGLPVPSPEDVARLPRSLPAGAGARIEWNDADAREVVFESIMRRVYWSSGPIAWIVPVGDIELWVWSPDGTLGDFVLGFGVEEGGIDYGDVLWHWGDYAY